MELRRPGTHDGLTLTSPLKWDPRLSSRGYSQSSRFSGFTGFLTPRRIVIGLAILLLLFVLYAVGSGDDDPVVTDDLAAEVERAESQAGYREVVVDVDGRTVTLSGTVPTPTDKVAATKVAESVADVIAVVADDLVAADTGPEPVTVAASAPELALQAELSAKAARSPVQFGTSSADLLDSSMVLLDEIVALLLDSPDVRVEIGGHTDADGDPTENQLLSEQRAATVVQYLIDRGVEAGRLTAVGYGDTEPVASNDTKEGKAENRRIEFIIIPG